MKFGILAGMYSPREIVRIVNEHLIEIEDKFHGRDARAVFTQGNCGFMPTLYKKTGVSVLPCYAVEGLIEKNRHASHIFSIIDFDWDYAPDSHENVRRLLKKHSYDITCGKGRPVIGMSKAAWFTRPDEEDIEYASFNFGTNDRDYKYHQEIRMNEKGRMDETSKLLGQRLAKLGMLNMKKCLKSGLYLPNESSELLQVGAI